MYAKRLSNLLTAIRRAGLDGFALNPSPTQFYLTGMEFHLMERPTVLIVTLDHDPLLVLPELEAQKLLNLPYPLSNLQFGDDPSTWQAAFDQAAASLGLAGKTIGVEPTWLRYLEANFLQKSAKDLVLTAAEDVVSQLRIKKDHQELAHMRRAVQIAQEALKATLPSIKAGMTEQQIASILTGELLAHGSSSRMPFAPIVSGGPNSANPHAAPSQRPLREGDLLVIDWGAAYEGYISDLTRTFAIGKVDAEYEKIAEVVKRANAAGRAAGKPGLTAGAVDAAARSVIEAAEYGQYFTHRVGHGIGMEGHEHPYMFGSNTLKLDVGMTYTVEPGIYLPERNGVRIEDNVVVTEDGCESLSDLPRELIHLG